MKEIIYDWFGWNEKIFYAINGLSSPVLDQPMILGTMLGKFTIFPLYLLVLIGYAYFDLNREKNSTPTQYPARRILWLQVIATLIVAYIANIVWVDVLKHFFSFPRPFAILPEGSVNILPQIKAAENPNVSFPSGHATFATLMAVGLWPVKNKLGRVLACLYVLWVITSRVYLGVHFPADVVGSAILSLIAVLIIRKLVIRFLPRFITIR